MDSWSELVGLVKARHYEAAANLYRRGDEPENWEKACDWHYTGTIALQLSGDMYGAKAAAERAMDMHPIGDTFMLVQFRLAFILREIGDVAEAIDRFTDLLARGDARFPMWSMMEGAVHQNLGVAYQAKREYTTAVSHYWAALNAFKREGVTTYICEILQNLAWTLAELGDIVGAQECLDTGYGAAASDEDRWYSRVVQAFIHLQAGRYLEAARIAETLLGGVLADPTTRAYAAWIAGAVALQLGHQQDALRMAQVASEWAAELKNVPIIRRAQELRAAAFNMEQGA